MMEISALLIVLSQFRPVILSEAKDLHSIVRRVQDDKINLLEIQLEN
jgi:hypothetical protein